ncbi:MAG: carbonic anhydrase [Gammaproteobacteria bacterium]|nr:carbonic anhydrase [Gammaproteobacteria bacterium]
MCNHHTPIDKLVEGFRRFHRAHFECNDPYYQALVREGQRPRVLFLACSDSRVDPAIVFGTQPGDLFIIRNVANIVPPYETNAGQHGVSAAIEYAVNVLEVEHIIINGHSQCGGIRALCEHPAEARIDSPSLVGRWLALARPAYERARADYPEADIDRLALECEKASILASLDNLMTFPMVKARVEAGKLKLHGWHFDIARGVLQAWNPQSGRFEALSG